MKLFKVFVLLVVSIIFFQSHVLATESAPYSRLAKLSASTPSGISINLGLAVTISGDGSRMIVSGSGNTYSFDRPQSGNWVDATETIVVPEQEADFYNSFGSQLAISFDGLTAAIGSSNYVGVFEWENNSWSQKAKLIPNFDAYSVSISGDGSTVVIGASGAYNGKGEVLEFSKNSSLKK